MLQITDVSTHHQKAHCTIILLKVTFASFESRVSPASQSASCGLYRVTSENVGPIAPNIAGNNALDQWSKKIKMTLT